MPSQTSTWKKWENVFLLPFSIFYSLLSFATFPNTIASCKAQAPSLYKLKTSPSKCNNECRKFILQLKLVGQFGVASEAREDS